MDTITYRYNTLITPSLILLNDPPLFLKVHRISEANLSPFPLYSSIPRTQIPDILTIHISGRCCSILRLFETK